MGKKVEGSGATRPSPCLHPKAPASHRHRRLVVSPPLFLFAVFAFCCSVPSRAKLWGLEKNTEKATYIFGLDDFAFFVEAHFIQFLNEEKSKI